MYQIEERYDAKTQEWICIITMPVEDKEQLEKVCSAAGYTIQDTTVGFFKWLIAEPNKALKWLRGDEM